MHVGECGHDHRTKTIELRLCLSVPRRVGPRTGGKSSPAGGRTRSTSGTCAGWAGLARPTRQRSCARSRTPLGPARSAASLRSQTASTSRGESRAGLSAEEPKLSALAPCSASHDTLRLWNTAELWTNSDSLKRTKSGVPFRIMAGHRSGTVSAICVCRTECFALDCADC